ncbi:MAG: class I SAM-dependent methyltransferase [Solirubrobacteraceae bacterium]
MTVTVMRERRLVFGEVAELYDRHRPAYPDRLIEDLIALARVDHRQPVLEVGAGTGKATRLFAARGITVVAIEPSAEMAAVARRNCSAYGNVEIEQNDFEEWDPAGRRFPLVFCAQAWHWVQPAAGYAKARQALLPQGILAAFWNRVAWTRCELREALLAAYQQTGSGLTPDSHTLHPANLCPDADADWEGEITAVQGLAGPEIRYYDWHHSYSAADYTGLLATLSEIRLLDHGRRTELFAAVTSAINVNGGRLTLPMRTRLCLAHRR